MKTFLSACLFFVIFHFTLTAQSPTVHWMNSMGGPGTILPRKTSVDVSGQFIYHTGYFTGTFDFDPGPAVYSMTASGYVPYLMKLDSSGSLIWAKQFEGSGNPYAMGHHIQPDDYGNVYVQGDLNGTLDFDPGPGVLNMSSSPNEPDIFIVKLDAWGNLIWAKVFGGDFSQWGGALSVEPVTSNLYIGGSFEYGAEVDPGPDTVYIGSNGMYEGFVLKLDSAGNFIWAFSLGGNGDDAVAGIFPHAGNLIVKGAFQSTADFNPGPGTYTMTSLAATIWDHNSFFLSIDTSSNFIWAKCLQSTEINSFDKIASDLDGNIYLSGVFYGNMDADPGPGIFNIQSSGMSDAFIAKYTGYGDLLWARSAGGPRHDQLSSVILSPDESALLLCGTFNDTMDIDPGPVVNHLISTGSSDAFLTSFDTAGNFLWVKQLEGAGNDGSVSLLSDYAGNIYFNGYFLSDILQLDGFSVQNTDTVKADAFFMKLNAANTSISSNNFFKGMHIYPNPAKNQIRIALQNNTDGIVEIRDAAGSVKKSISLSQDIYIGDLKQGIYTVIMNTKNGVFSEKLVKL